MKRSPSRATCASSSSVSRPSTASDARARQRVAAEGRRVTPRGIDAAMAPRDRRHTDRDPARESLSQADDVRRHALVLEREEAARSCRSPVWISSTISRTPARWPARRTAAQVPGRRHDDAALALDGLDDDGGRASSSGRAQAPRRRRTSTCSNSHSSGSNGAAVLRRVGGRQRAERLAVVPAAAGDEPLPARSPSRRT